MMDSVHAILSSRRRNKDLKALKGHHVSPYRHRHAFFGVILSLPTPTTLELPPTNCRIGNKLESLDDLIDDGLAEEMCSLGATSSLGTKLQET